MSTLPPDAVTEYVRPTDMTVSPDGRRVSFLTLENDEGAQHHSVYIVPTDGSQEPVRLTRCAGVTDFGWSPDSSRLGVVMAREHEVDDADQADRDGAGPVANDETSSDEQPQLWVYDVDRGGEPKRVTTHDEGIKSFDWGPTGERVVVAAADPTPEERAYRERRRNGGPIETERLQHVFDGTGWLDTVTTYLFVVDVDSGDSRRLDAAHGGGITEEFDGLHPAWHPTDDRIAFVANHGENQEDTYVQDIHVVDVATGEIEWRTDGTHKIDGGPRWSPDGNRLAVFAGDPENWYVPTDLWIAEPDADEWWPVTADLNRHPAWFETFAWLDTDRLITAIGDGGWSRFVRLTVGNSNNQAASHHERVYDCQRRDESLAGFDVGTGTVVFARQDPQRGIDLFALETDDLEASSVEDDPRERLTTLNSALVSTYTFPEMARVKFAGVDGDTVEGIAFFDPSFDPDDPAKSRPLLLSIHGGPRRYDGPHFDFDTAFWTSRGYIVFKVNYHGSTSYGRSFCERLRGHWNDVEVRDLLAGVDELVHRGWVDPDRLFVTGFSYGGRSTAWILTKTDRFAVAVAEHGTYDSRSAFGTDDSHKWWENELGLPWENPKEYDRTSSITNVDEIETPLMLMAGGEDYRCRSTQAEQLHVSLQKRRVESKLVVYPETSHVHYFVADPDRAMHRLETMEAWFDRFDPGS